MAIILMVTNLYFHTFNLFGLSLSGASVTCSQPFAVVAGVRAGWVNPATADDDVATAGQLIIPLPYPAAGHGIVAGRSFTASGVSFYKWVDERQLAPAQSTVHVQFPGGYVVAVIVATASAFPPVFSIQAE